MDDLRLGRLMRGSLVTLVAWVVGGAAAQMSAQTSPPPPPLPRNADEALRQAVPGLRSNINLEGDENPNYFPEIPRAFGSPAELREFLEETDRVPMSKWTDEQLEDLWNE